MSKKHDPIIHAAIIQAAATLTASYYAAKKPLKESVFDSAPTEADLGNQFARMLEQVETRFDNHIRRHNDG
ncbi:MAG: hypothetical protein ACTIDN_00215 [Acetobacter sp.]|uniref:hypothetical protein n=1 Tax=Acetobacter sp. TaxID=440 RepID=UPI003F924816